MVEFTVDKFLHCKKGFTKYPHSHSECHQLDAFAEEVLIAGKFMLHLGSVRSLASRS